MRIRSGIWKASSRGRIFTFTGRADIWELALEKIAERPITGWGYQAYWALESTRFGQEDTTQWAGHAAHAHNGYIDAVEKAERERKEREALEWAAAEVVSDDDLSKGDDI